MTASSCIVGQEAAFLAQLLQQGVDLGILEVNAFLLAAVNPAGQDEEEQVLGIEDEFHPGRVVDRSREGEDFP